MPLKDPIKEKERKRLSGIKHREARNQRRREKYANDAKYRNKILKIRKKFREDNLEKEREREKEYKRRNNPKVQEYKNKKYITDPNYRIAQTLRVRMRKAVKNNSKTSISFLGADIDKVKEHLEKQFKEGMSWENYGPQGWHIDHIKPCASFNLEDTEEQKKCFNYKNLQPLWAKENRSKHNKLNWKCTLN